MSAELNMQRVTTLKAEPLTPLAEVEKQLSIATAKAVGAPVLDMKKIKTGKTVTIKEVPERPGSADFSDIHGSHAESGDSQDDQLIVKKVSIFDEIQHKVKRNEITFIKGVAEMKDIYENFEDRIQAKLFEFDQRIKSSLKYQTTIDTQQE